MTEKLTVLNPWTKARMSLDPTEYSEHDCILFASRMSDAERWQCEDSGDCAAWITRVVNTLGPVRSGHIFMS